ncbi:MAG: hypothetical protein LW742_01650 [Sphingomonadales bacterium]|nr:hypothetical protein [Sphingomonadales bacterium]
MALTPTDRRDASDEAFLREVDDAVRAGDLAHFWTRYGRWMLLAIVLGLAAFGGWIYWQNQQQAAAVAAAKADLGTLTTADQPGYRAMSQILLANIAAAEGNSKKAVADYAKIAKDESLPEAFRNLALIRQTTTEYETLSPQAVIDRLKPLAKPNTPWFGSAGEMTALAYMKMGKDELAGPIFAQIAKQEDLPQTLRARAQQMAGALGVDTVQLDAKRTGASATDAKEGK